MFLTSMPHPDYIEINYFGITVHCPKKGYLYIAKDYTTQYFVVVHSENLPGSEYFHQGESSSIITYVKLDGKYNFKESIMKITIPKVLKISMPVNEDVHYDVLNIDIELPKARTNYSYLYIIPDVNSTSNRYFVMFSTSTPISKTNQDELFIHWYSKDQKIVATVETDEPWNTSFIQKSLQRI